MRLFTFIFTSLLAVGVFTTAQAQVAQPMFVPGSGLYAQCPEGQTCVHNRNSKSLANQMHIIMFNLSNGQSANANLTNPWDVTRLETYQAQLKGYIDHVNATQVIDQPHSFPYVFVMSTLDGVQYTSNENVNEILDMYLVWWTEVVNGVSARIPNGWWKDDYNRYLAIWEQINHYIETVLKTVSPTDKPATAHIVPTIPGGPALNPPNSPLIGPPSVP